jgi:thiamine pyrophosphate-dependent acetolactate synthase large subunit-like protein
MSKWLLCVQIRQFEQEMGAKPCRLQRRIKGISAGAQMSFLKCLEARARSTCLVIRERPSCPLIDALVDATDISYVLALQEASAVAMADGYAQAACRPGVLNLHTAGGLGHGFGNLLNACVSNHMRRET